MTVHSTQKRTTHREQFDKAVHAKAHHDNIRFQQALGEYTAPQNTQLRTHRGGHTSRPIPDYSLRPSQLLEDTAEPEFEDIYDFRVDFASSPSAVVEPRANMIVSLLDLTRPARGKGKVVA